MPLSLCTALLIIFVASLSGVVGYSPPLLHPNFSQCKLEILNNSTLDSDPAFRPLFVDIDGRPAKGQYDIKGVDYTTCISYCGTTSELPKWSFFAPQFTAWLLPFVALTAQFPYQASTTWDNFMSAFLTVGSPALAVYSLVLTFLNARWLHRRCYEITESMVVSTPEERERKNRVKSIFKSMRRVVSLAQQEPYEDVNFDIPDTNNIDKALEDDDEWWKKLVAAAEKTKRGYTASFVHQLLWVNIAFAFTIVDAFGSEKIGNNATAFGLAIALVWQWETPIVMGWVLVGTQAVNSGVRDAIREIKELNINQEPRAARFFEPYSLSRRRGLIKGDRGRPGPIFNYARISIWTYRAEEIVDFYRQSFESEALNRMPYILTDGHWRIVARDHILYAFASALLLQWSTAGASIFLNWLTPTIGLSCRSGGILIYATCGTIVLIFLMLASFLSDFWAQESLHRAEVRRAPWYKPISLLGYFSVFLRTMGKTIAIANSFWICIHCMFEFTSFYENCWCKANYASKGNSGFWTWVSDAELRQYNNVSQVWGGATAMAVLISGLFVAFFLVAHHHYRL